MQLETWKRDINKELVAALIFIVVSGAYIEVVYGFGKVFDTLFLWMFPASIMIFLTLLAVKIIDVIARKRAMLTRLKKSKSYVDWSKR